MDNIQVILKMTNLRKKYVRIMEIIDTLDVFKLIQQDGNLLLDLFNGTFDDSIQGSSVRLVVKIFKNLYTKTTSMLYPQSKQLSNQEEVMIVEYLIPFWIEQYINALKLNKDLYYLNTSQFLNRALTEVRPQAIIVVLKHLRERDPDFSQRHIIWGQVSLIRFAKVIGYIQLDPVNDCLSSKLGMQVQFPTSVFRRLLFNLDRAIQLETLRAVLDTNKMTEPPSAFEYEVVLQFLRMGLRTSHPNYRKEYLVQLRWFFERTRRCYEKDIELLMVGKASKKDISRLKEFLVESVEVLYSHLYPDVLFEQANPVVEILKMIYTFLGNPISLEYRKGYFLKPIKFLQSQAYSENCFEQLLTQMSSSWESVRTMSYEIIMLFPTDTPYFTQARLQKLYEQAIILITNPVIRWYENGAYILTWLFQRFSHILFPDQQNHQLSYLQNLLSEFKSRYNKFRSVFATDPDALQDSLIHGFICSFSLILQREDIKFFQNETIKIFMSDLIETLRDVMEFATQLSSDNMCTWVLDDHTKQQDQRGQELQVDCRGHFYFKKEDTEEQEKFRKTLGALMQGNTLVESLEEDESVPENILVVAFYLVTREAGQFFQSLAQLLQTHDKSECNAVTLVETDVLRAIIHQFFHALLNIKHLGSIDRIAQGLNQVARVVGGSKIQQTSSSSTANPQLPNLVSQLLDRLTQAFQENSLKGIFRRSAGLPHLVNCLLKALSQEQRPAPLKKVVGMLFKFVEGEKVELKVHALNILRKLFQEAQLRYEMEDYLGVAFKKSVECFAYDDWSVRNSSLMLFSALGARSIGKHNNSEKLTSRKNFIEFFVRAPELVPFFLEQFKIYLTADNVPMYPSLYPIALLLSRLVPLDTRMHSTVEPLEEQKKHLVDLKQVNEMLPLLIDCSRNRNQLGRLMVSKALLPFLSFEEVPLWAANLISTIGGCLVEAQRDHNRTHGFLMIAYQVVKDYFGIRDESDKFQSIETLNKLIENEKQLLNQLVHMSFLFIGMKCPPVQTTFLQLLIVLMKKISMKQQQQFYYQEITEQIELLLKPFELFCQQQIQLCLQQQLFKIPKDLGDSILRKKMISFILKFKGIYQLQPSIEYHLYMINQISSKYMNDPLLILKDDMEVFMFVLKQFHLIIKTNPSLVKQAIDQVNSAFKGLGSLLQLKQSNQPSFSLVIQQILRAVYSIYKAGYGTSGILDLSSLVQVHLQSTNQNALTQAIKLLGVAVASGQATPSTVKKYLEICEQYSQSNNIDDLRIAVIKSLMISHDSLFQHFKEQQLGFFKVYVRLLQDEIPEIRQRVSKFLCWNKTKNASEYLNFDFVIIQFFQNEIYFSDFEESVRFLLNIIFAEDFTECKKQNHTLKKIFSRGKDNTFHNDILVAQLAYECLIKQIQKNPDNLKLIDQIMQDTLNFQLLKRLQNNIMIENKCTMLNKKTDFLKMSIETVKQYQIDFVKRDEFLFENLYKVIIYESLQKVIIPEHQFSEIYEIIIHESSLFDSNLKRLAKIKI